MRRSDKDRRRSKRQVLAYGPLLFCAVLWLLLAGAALPPAFADEPAEGRIVFDVDDPPDLNYALTDWLRFGAETDTEFFLQNNLDLDDGEDDRLAGLTPELGLAWGIALTPYADAYLGILFEQGVDFIAPGSEQHREASLVIDEVYLNLREPIDGLSFRIGRARVADFGWELDPVQPVQERALGWLDAGTGGPGGAPGVRDRSDPAVPGGRDAERGSLQHR